MHRIDPIRRRVARADRAILNARPAPAIVETLESRQLLSASLAGGLSSADANFLNKLDSNLTLEIEIGSSAQAHGTNAQVKTLAQRVVTSDTAILTQLQSLGTAVGMSLSNSLDAADQHAANRILPLTGVKLDKLYSQQAVADHRSEITAMERELGKTSVTAIQTFVDSALPTLQTDQEFAVAAEDAAKAEYAALVTRLFPSMGNGSGNRSVATSISSKGVIQIGTSTMSSTSSGNTGTSIVNGVITIGNANGTSAAGQVGAGTQGQVGVGTEGQVGVSTSGSGTGVQTVIVTSGGFLS